MKKVKRGRIPKRGISPLIATVLLIGFVIALLLLIMLWGKNYIEELAAKRGALAQKQQECQLVGITVKSLSFQDTTATLVIENTKDKQIDKFIFRSMKENGDSIEVMESFNKLGGLEVNQYEVPFTKSGAEKVDVIPSLKAGKNKYVPCSEQHVTVKRI
ncbi:MAG: archaellin/type IV pilin N-terminal domain-containing protein [Candidatus Nanoarchaeia archaeon]